MSVETLLHTISEHAQSHLRPFWSVRLTAKVCTPIEYLHELGAIGGFCCTGGREFGGSDLGLAAQIRVLSAVGAECGATAFMGWVNQPARGICAKAATLPYARNIYLTF